MELLTRACLASGIEAPADNPLSHMIAPGQNVLLKPNWVLHRNHSGKGLECMITDPRFVLAVLELVCRASPRRVTIGDAPVQSCRFEEIVGSDFLTEARRIADRQGVPLQVLDFRRTIADRGVSAHLHNDVRPLSEYVQVDLGFESMLEPVSRVPGRFRVTCYDPRRLASKHGPGMHAYLLCREALNADVIINLPKLKTHKKTGLTGALKNLVGLNGDKDFLPHHRMGGTAEGGDCYPGSSARLRLAERAMDRANRYLGRSWHRPLELMAAVLLKCGQRDPQVSLESNWYGNDTCWRTVLDINRAALYSRLDGVLSDKPLRKIFTLTDALICGQGEGPLSPVPLWIGAVTASECPASADLIHAALLRLDWRKLPLIRHARDPFPYPIVSNGMPVEFVCDGQHLTWEEAARTIGRSALPPAGWIGHVEWLESGKAPKALLRDKGTVEDRMNIRRLITPCRL